MTPDGAVFNVYLTCAWLSEITLPMILSQKAILGSEIRWLGLGWARIEDGWAPRRSLHIPFPISRIA